MKTPLLTRRRRRSIAGFAAFLLVCWYAFISLAAMQTARDKERRSSCRANLRQLYLAMQSYLEDNDGYYPPTQIGGTRVVGQLTTSATGTIPTTTPVGWADAITRYSHSISLFMCPAEPGKPYSIYPAKVGYTDYWMNACLSSKEKQQIMFPAATLLLGEGNDGHDQSNATYSKMAFPASWLSDLHSPAARHLGGANYLMTDGTIRWLHPEKVPVLEGRRDAFALR